MREYVVNRPEEDAMRRALTHIGPEVIVLRLAWQAGLSRDEISALTWEQVSFLDNRLELPDRMVPLDPDLRTALWRLYESNHELSPRVVLSSRGKSPLAPESISRLARQAAAGGGSPPAAARRRSPGAADTAVQKTSGSPPPVPPHPGGADPGRHGAHAAAGSAAERDPGR